MENNEIQFHKPEYRIPTRQIQRNLFADFLVKKGWAKDKQQAMYILLGVIGVCVLVTMFVMFGGKNEPDQIYDGGSNPAYQINQP